MRAKVSVVEPGADGITIFTVRDGKGSSALLGNGQSIALAAEVRPSRRAKRNIDASVAGTAFGPSTLNEPAVRANVEVINDPLRRQLRAKHGAVAWSPASSLRAGLSGTSIDLFGIKR